MTQEKPTAEFDQKSAFYYRRIDLENRIIREGQDPVLRHLLSKWHYWL